MQIARVKNIKNVGTFVDFPNGASLGFEKLTFIYGFNTFGKTTLTDIFQSIKDNNPNLILSRKSIPRQEQAQKIEISIKENGGSEQQLVFQNDNWVNNTISKHLEVFGSEFIHKNLFTGLKAERENKENFTQFILGEDGVGQAQIIAEKKKLSGDKKRDIKNKIPIFVKDKTNAEIQSFLDLSIEGLDESTLQQRLLDIQHERQIETNRLKEPQKILSLPDIQVLHFETIQIDLYMKKINDALKSDYSNIKEEVLKRVDEHIVSTFRNNENATNWIKQGLETNKNITNGICSFCGQSLSESQELMKAYDSYFDIAYNEYIENIEKVFKENMHFIEKQKYSYKSKAQELLTNVMRYKDIDKSQDFKLLLIEIESKVTTINEEDIAIKHLELCKTIQQNIEEKLRKPYIAVSEIDFNGFKEILVAYESLLTDIKGTVENLKIQTNNFKNSYRDTQAIQDKIIAYDGSIKDLEKIIARINQNQQCIDYIGDKLLISSLEIELSRLEAELAQNQTQYLTTYFSKINELFRKFGSSNFSLEMTSSNRGHSPIYFLDVKFHTQKINDDELKTVFSESDRRALALAVFWAKIELKPLEEKLKTVVVLDDPITSFDDNRISNSIDLFKESLHTLSQIIVLTHYPSFLKNFCERTKESTLTTKILKIEKNATSSVLMLESRETFTDSQYEKAFSKILDFIHRKHNNCIKSDLRPFLESLYLPTVFASNIREALANGKDLSSLDKTIDAIFNNQSVKSKFHSFRNNLNPEAHIITSNNSEDVRTFATEMMNYLYSFDFHEQ